MTNVFEIVGKETPSDLVLKRRALTLAGLHACMRADESSDRAVKPLWSKDLHHFGFGVQCAIT